MKTKYCSECQVEKDISFFHIRSSVKGTFQNYCKDCRKIRDARIWQDNKYGKREKVKNWKEDSRRKYQEYKRNLSCKICGETSEECLDFHHLDPKEKDLAVSALINRSSWEVILSEIEKCIVLCANCHRKVHAGRVVLTSNPTS